jgi:hypothetical protein
VRRCAQSVAAVTAEHRAPDFWDNAPREHPTHLYGQRAQRVYWDKTFPACRAKGPGRSECLLNPDHNGEHFGNGFDNWGPTGATWWK